MTSPKFDIEKDFLVRESKTTNFILGGLLLFVFLISMVYSSDDWLTFIGSTCIFLIPGTVAIARGIRNALIIKINKTGFYYAGQLITNWNLFYDAVVENRMGVGRFQDNFFLDIRYSSSDYTKIYLRSIPLTNIQDKSEEEIIEAIRFYYKSSQMDNLDNTTKLPH